MKVSLLTGNNPFYLRESYDANHHSLKALDDIHYKSYTAHNNLSKVDHGKPRNLNDEDWMWHGPYPDRDEAFHTKALHAHEKVYTYADEIRKEHDPEQVDNPKPIPANKMKKLKKLQNKALNHHRDWHIHMQEHHEEGARHCKQAYDEYKNASKELSGDEDFNKLAELHLKAHKSHKAAWEDHIVNPEYGHSSYEKTNLSMQDYQSATDHVKKISERLHSQHQEHIDHHVNELKKFNHPGFSGIIPAKQKHKKAIKNHTLAQEDVKESIWPHYYDENSHYFSRSKKLLQGNK